MLRFHEPIIRRNHGRVQQLDGAPTLFTAWMGGAYSGASWPSIPIEVGHPFRCEVGHLFRRDVGHFSGYPGMSGQHHPGIGGQDPGIILGI